MRTTRKGMRRIFRKPLTEKDWAEEHGTALKEFLKTAGYAAWRVREDTRMENTEKYGKRVAEWQR